MAARATYIVATAANFFSLSPSAAADVITRTGDCSASAAVTVADLGHEGAQRRERQRGREREREREREIEREGGRGRPREGGPDGRNDGRTHINLKKSFARPSAMAASATTMAVCGIFVEPFLSPL